MAIQAVLKRNYALRSSDGAIETGVATFTGTYVPGGFPVDCTQVAGGPGSSPRGGLPLRLQFDSPLGYTYVATFNKTQLANVKVYSAANTELGAVALEPTMPFFLWRRQSSY